MKNKGFTMVELLAVIIILGILSVMAIVGVNRLIDKSREEELRQQKETVKMAAQAYMQSNPQKLPKLIGDSRDLKVQYLKDKKYLKEDIENAKKEDCMENSFVRVIKKSNTKFAYETHILCGKKSFDEGSDDRPTIDIYFVDSLGTKVEKLEEVFKNPEKETLYIKMTGGIDKKEEKNLKLAGYSFVVYAEINGKKREVYNSGTIGVEDKYELLHQQKLSEFLDVTTGTNFTIEVTAFNEKGKREIVTAGKKYQDKEIPKCSGIEGQAKSGSDWINKDDYYENGKMRFITAGCKDVGASGCIRKSFTRGWPEKAKPTGAEWGYIQVIDNAGNKSIEDGSNYLKDPCLLKESELKNSCRVRVNVDIEKPKITVSSSKLNKTIVIDDSTGNQTINTDKFKGLNNGWMNKASFGSGVEFTVVIEDDLHLASYVWETNPAKINSKNGKYESYSSSNPEGFSVKKLDDLESNKNNCGERKKTKIKLTLKSEGMRKGRLTVKDKAGNKTIVYIVANIDRTNPPAPTIVGYKKGEASVSNENGLKNKYTFNTWYSGYVLTKASGSKEKDWESGFEGFYLTTSKQDKDVTDSKQVYRNVNKQGTVTIKYRAKDKAGNWSAYTTVYTKLDRTAPKPPTIVGYKKGEASVSNENGLKNKYTFNTWYSGYVLTKATGSEETGDTSGLEGYYLTTSGQDKNVTNSKQIYRNVNKQGTVTIKYRAKDNAGNWSAYTTVYTKLDRIAPKKPTIVGYKKGEASVSNENGLTNKYTFNKWYSGYVLTKATGSEEKGDVSGLEGYYLTTAGQDKNVTNSKQIYRNVNKQGTVTIKYRAKDNAGNWSGYTTVYTKLDRIAPKIPTITGYKRKNSTSVNNEKGLTNNKYNFKDWYSGYVLTKASGSEETGDTSGLEGYYLTTSGQDSNITNSKQVYRNVNKQGTVTIKYRAKDKAGNWSSYATVYTYLDRKPPTCSISKSDTYDESGVALTTTCKDEKAEGTNSSSGVKICIKDDAKEKKYNNVKTGGEDEKKYTYTVTDVAENKNECSKTVYRQRQKRTRSWDPYKYSEQVVDYNSCNEVHTGGCGDYYLYVKSCSCNGTAHAGESCIAVKCRYKTEYTGGWTDWSSWETVNSCSDSDEVDCRTRYY